MRRLGIEWKPQDFWVGVFWRRTFYKLDVWVCIIPMLPIHYERDYPPGLFSRIVRVLTDHPKLDAILLRLFPILHLYVYSRREWLVCREFNDGPDECYWEWPRYWKMVKDLSHAQDR